MSRQDRVRKDTLRFLESIGSEPCHKCGKMTPLDLLDAKDDGTGDYTILECKKCYGPGWLPMAFDREVKP